MGAAERFDAEMAARLEGLRDEGLYKSERVIASMQAGEVRLADGRAVWVPDLLRSMLRDTPLAVLERLEAAGCAVCGDGDSTDDNPIVYCDTDGCGGSRCVLASRSPPSRRVVAARVPAGACCDAARPTVDPADGSLGQRLASIAARSMSSAVLQRAALKFFYVNYQVFLDHCLDSYGCESACTLHLANRVLLVPYTPLDNPTGH